jgi:hypothetical protein
MLECTIHTHAFSSCALVATNMQLQLAADVRALCRSKRTPARSVQAEGLFGALAAGLLGFLPLVKLGDEDTAYDAYRIPQRCEVPRRSG